MGTSLRDHLRSSAAVGDSRGNLFYSVVGEQDAASFLCCGTEQRASERKVTVPRRAEYSEGDDTVALNLKGGKERKVPGPSNRDPRLDHPP
jgi:hypothetical protein